MKIIISPAKKMEICNYDILSESTPCFIEKTQILYEVLRNLSYEDLKLLLSCNDDIALLNFERYAHMNLKKNLTPAILSYNGIQYKYMAPNVFNNNEFDYLKRHLRILSGFYGILNPFDGVVPYRLEMQAKLKFDNYKNLYNFWGDSIYKELTKNDNIILNLASKEYSKTVEKYLTSKDLFITCIFGTLKDSKIKIKATEAKMARGLMVRYLAENQIENVEKIKNFSELNFSYSEEYSTEKEFVFLN
ncbi:MAG: peroxide stress protein YaaA [Clostridium sp.]|nr:peroxide stress protein YaaA [Clostridium sp.]MCI7441870.1 peroxide stress protein YaaA [Clostridium sp.]